MPDIDFICFPFEPARRQMLSGSDHYTAIHVGLREVIGERFDIDFEYIHARSTTAQPVEPDRLMIAVATDKCFAVYTDYGRLLAAGRNKRFDRGIGDLYLPDGVTCLHRECLSGMRMERLYLPHRVYLADGCFEGLRACEIVYPCEDFTAHPGYIPERAFANSSLEQVTVWDGVWALSSEAFLGCDRLRSVSLPRSIRSIGKDVFKGCPRDLHIIFRGTREEWDAVAKREPSVTNEYHYDNSRVGYDHGTKHRTGGWIDFDTYTLEFTEE